MVSEGGVIAFHFPSLLINFRGFNFREPLTMHENINENKTYMKIKGLLSNCRLLTLEVGAQVLCLLPWRT